MVVDLAQPHIVTGLWFGIYIIIPNILEIFCCSDSLVIGCMIARTYTLPGAFLQSGVNQNGLEIQYTIQYKLLWKPCFSYNTSLKKNPIVFRGSQSTIYHTPENVFGCWVELFDTRHYNNGFLI